MTPTQLRAELEDLFGAHKTAERAAEALHCTQRCIFYWLTGERQIPGPVIAALKLARACPPDVLPDAWKAHLARGAPTDTLESQRHRPDRAEAPISGRDRRDVINVRTVQGTELP